MYCSITMIRGLVDVGGEATPADEAADPPSPAEVADETTLGELAKNVPQAGHSAQAGQEIEEVAEVVEYALEAEEPGPSNPTLTQRYAGPMTPFPEQMDVRDQTQPRSFELDESGRPKKQAKTSAPSQQVMAVVEIDHEDEPTLRMRILTTWRTTATPLRMSRCLTRSMLVMWILCWIGCLDRGGARSYRGWVAGVGCSCRLCGDCKVATTRSLDSSRGSGNPGSEEVVD